MTLAECLSSRHRRGAGLVEEIRPLALVALAAAAGCAGGARLGPDRGMPETPETLARSVEERARAVETLHSVDSRLRYTGPFRGKRRSLPARADIFVAGEDRFRFQVKHPLTGTDLFSLIVNGGRFLLVALTERKAREGDCAKALADALPGYDARDGVPAPREIFFPLARERSGESSAMAIRRGRYVLEFWRPDRVPTRRLEVDAWSHVPLKAELFGADGELAGLLRWSGFSWRAKEGVVVPRELEVLLPKEGVALRLSFPSLRLNSSISPRAFSLQVPPGIELEAPGGGAGARPASAED